MKTQPAVHGLLAGMTHQVKRRQQLELSLSDGAHCARLWKSLPAQAQTAAAQQFARLLLKAAKVTSPITTTRNERNETDDG